MRTVDQLRELAKSFRSKEKRRTDAALVELIKADVQEYRHVRATMPAFIRGIRTCRELGAGDDGYDDWRERWFRLDQLRNEPGRRDRVRSALAAAR